MIDYDEVARLAEEHRPKMIIAGASAYPRIIDFAQFREIADSGRRVVPGRHGAFLGSGRGGALSESVRARRYRDLDDAQDPARTSRRHDSCRRRSSARRSTRAVFPGAQGGPLVHVIAGKAVCFLEALQPEFRELSAAGDRERSGLGRRPCGRRLPRGLRRHGYAPAAGGRVREGCSRQGSGDGAR